MFSTTIPNSSWEYGNVIFYFQRMLCNSCDRETAALWWSIRTFFEPLHQKLLKKFKDLWGKKISTSPSNSSRIKVQINKKNDICRFSSTTQYFTLTMNLTKFKSISRIQNKIVKTSSNVWRVLIIRKKVGQDKGWNGG